MLVRRVREICGGCPSSPFGISLESPFRPRTSKLRQTSKSLDFPASGLEDRELMSSFAVSDPEDPASMSSCFFLVVEFSFRKKDDDNAAVLTCQVQPGEAQTGSLVLKEIVPALLASCRPLDSSLQLFLSSVPL